MITHLRIKDFATIKNIEVDFHNGLNIITGESGAGKSVVIAAIALALGSRADTTYVRSGCEKAVIQLMVDTPSNELVLTREVYANGKSIARINGEIVSLGELNKTAAGLADIHGQYEHQYLLNTANHIKLIDIYERNMIKQAKERVAELYQQYKDVTTHLEELQAMAADNGRQKEFMEYEIQEIRQADLILGEDQILVDRLQEMQHVEVIYKMLANAYLCAKEMDTNALDAIGAVIRELRGASQLSKEAANFEDEFSDIYYRFDDLATRLRSARDHYVFSQDELDAANDRLYLINDLKKKYGDTIDAILDHAETQEKKLRSLQSLESDLESVAMEQISIRQMLEEASDRLTQLRRTASNALEDKIQLELFALNFSDVHVSTQFHQKPYFAPEGRDDVEFMISTNKGEKMKPLAKIVSGGEMSRIMLAFKKVMSDYDQIPTLIFDEIDAGISGETAVLVGRAIRNLSDTRQIITITHLPQIASFGTHNYTISKSTDDENTFTTIEELSESEKAAEIARLIAGLNVSDLTLKNAKEMIEQTRFF